MFFVGANTRFAPTVLRMLPLAALSRRLNQQPPTNTFEASRSGVGRHFPGNYGNVTIMNTSCEARRNGNELVITLPLIP